MANEVRIRTSVTGAKQATGEVTSLRGAFDRLQKQGAKGFGIGVGAAATTKAFSLVDRAISGTVQALGDAAQAYRDDELSQAKLRTSLAANVAAWSGNARAIERVLEERIKLGFSDDEQRDSLAKLVAITHDETRALEIQRTAMDLARLRGMDLASATELLGKVAGGNVSILRRYGIVIEAGASATEALAAVQKMAAGQAESWARTVGKVEVSEIRAAEASEKFGKSVARLQGEVMPLAADAVSGFADVVDGLQTGLDDSVPALDRMDAQVQALQSNIWTHMIPGMEGWVESMADAADKAREADEALAEQGDSISRSGRLSSKAADQTDDLTDELADLETQARDTEREIDDLADTFVDELYGDTIRAGREADLVGRIRDLTKELKATKPGTLAARELKGELADVRGQLFLLHLEQAKKKGNQAAIAFLRAEREKAGAAKAMIDQLIVSYQKLANKQGTLGPIIVPISPTKLRNIGFYAEGGRPTPGQPAIVGEEGPELIVPDTASTVIPLGGGSGGTMAGGDLHVHVTVDGGVLTPGGMEALGHKIGPGIATYLQRRGLLARAH